MMWAVARGVISSARASSTAASPYPYCRKVLVDMPNALSRSNFQWRGKSVAASVNSDSSIPSKLRRKITKDERRAMAVSFVDKYRATNAGKFPSASLTKQQIGGSYYTIREIVQELKYKSKFSPVKETEKLLLDKEEEDTCTSSDATKELSLTKESSVSVSVENCIFHEHSLSVNIDKTELLTVPSYDIKNSTVGAAIPVHSMTNDSVRQILECVENSNNGLSHVDNGHLPYGHEVSDDASATYSAISSSKDSAADVTVSIGSHSAQAKSDITQGKPKSFSGGPDGSRGDVDGLNEAEQKNNQEPLRAEDLYRPLEHEETSPNKTTVWGSLKSLAHGIISFWKNK